MSHSRPIFVPLDQMSVSHWTCIYYILLKTLYLYIQGLPPLNIKTIQNSERKSSQNKEWKVGRQRPPETPKYCWTKFKTRHETSHQKSNNLPFFQNPNLQGISQLFLFFLFNRLKFINISKDQCLYLKHTMSQNVL